MPVESSMQFYNIAAIVLSLFGAVYTAVYSFIQSVNDIFAEKYGDIKNAHKEIVDKSGNDELKNNSKRDLKALEKCRIKLARVKNCIVSVFCVFAFGMSLSAPFCWSAVIKNICWQWGVFTIAILAIGSLYYSWRLCDKINDLVDKMKDHEKVYKDSIGFRFKNNIMSPEDIPPN